MIERYIGRLLTDDCFRAEVRRSFHHACSAEGFTFSSNEEQIVRTIDTGHFDKLASTLDGAIKRCCRVIRPENTS